MKLKRLIAGAAVAAAASVPLSLGASYADPHRAWWWFILNGILLGIASQPIPGASI